MAPNKSPDSNSPAEWKESYRNYVITTINIFWNNAF